MPKPNRKDNELIGLQNKVNDLQRQLDTRVKQIADLEARLALMSAGQTYAGAGAQAVIEENARLRLELDARRELVPWEVLAPDPAALLPEPAPVYDYDTETGTVERRLLQPGERPANPIVGCTLVVRQDVPQDNVKVYHFGPFFYQGTAEQAEQELPRQFLFILNRIPAPEDLPSAGKIPGLSDEKLGTMLQEMATAREIDRIVGDTEMKRYTERRLEAWQEYKELAGLQAIDRRDFHRFFNTGFENYDARLRNLKIYFAPTHAGKKGGKTRSPQK